MCICAADGSSIKKRGEAAVQHAGGRLPCEDEVDYDI